MAIVKVELDMLEIINLEYAIDVTISNNKKLAEKAREKGDFDLAQRFLEPNSSLVTLRSKLEVIRENK